MTWKETKQLIYADLKRLTPTIMGGGNHLPVAHHQPFV